MKCKDIRAVRLHLFWGTAACVVTSVTLMLMCRKDPRRIWYDGIDDVPVENVENLAVD